MRTIALVLAVTLAMPGAGLAPGAAPVGQAEVTAERGPRVKIGNDETQS